MIAVIAVLTPAAHAHAQTGADLLVDRATHLVFDTAEGWRQQPGWLPNPSANATLEVADGVACFRVPQARQGMKWSCELGGVWLPETPYLVMRYRAQNYDREAGGYFVFLDDDAKQGEVHALKPSHVVDDGQWHTVAADAQSVANGDGVRALAVQVQADDAGDARVWIDHLGFVSHPPAGAELIGVEEAPTVPDFAFPLAESAWEAQPDWLGAVAERHAVRVDDGTPSFESREAGLGMKWLWQLPEVVPLIGHRYLVVRYRATNVSRAGDYAIAVLGDTLDGGMNYTAAAMPSTWQADGRWHTAPVDIRQVAARFPEIEALAVQVLTGREAPARLEIESLRLTAEPVAQPLSDWLDLREREMGEGFRAVELPAQRNLDLDAMLDALDIAGNLAGREVSANGVPFRLAEAPELLSTSLNGTGELSLPASGKGTELCLLTFSLLRGKEEPSRGSGKLTAIRDVDRFRLAVRYADGVTDEFLPVDVVTGRHEVRSGPQVLCVPLDSERELAEIGLREETDRGAFAIAAATVRTRGTSTPFDAARDLAAAAVAQSDVERRGAGARMRLSVEGGIARWSGDDAAFALRLAPTPGVAELRNGNTDGDYLQRTQLSSLVQFAVEGQRLSADDLTDARIADARGNAVSASYRLGETGVEVNLAGAPSATGELSLRLRLTNASAEPKRVEAMGPQVSGYVLGERLEDNWYFALSRSLRFDNQPTRIRARHCGAGSPLQFVATFNPRADEGLYLRTEDTVGDCRNYVVEKTDTGMSLGVEYPTRTLAPGETVEFAPAVLGICEGDWRPAFHAYRNWLKTWYRPAAPRKQWFREVFNFRQRFLYQWGPLFDQETKRLDVPSALDEGKRNFGGVEYVHLFDWGSVPQYGRVYGRVGDHSPFDEGLKRWEKAELRSQIGRLQQDGVRAGLYIEGYLLQEKGKLGGGRGKAWQIKNANGEPLYWPESSEMFVCPWVRDWQEVQAQTYANMVRDLGVNGMYIDQFGFANNGKDCFDPDHGHPVPGYCMLGERDCTKRIREAVDAAKPGVALYTEEIPPDVNSQYQDGSFTYTMRHSLLQNARVPLNLFRFAVPSFKSFQILMCDKPTGTWATGVKWTFFNGDGLWLEGVAEDWFAPLTLAAIRKCHAILREHRDAFTSDEPEPLVPTEMPGVYANLFPTPGKHVYTLWNSHYRTVRGNMLRVERRPGVAYRDGWRGRTLTPTRAGNYDILNVEIGPRDVGCIVCTRG